VRLAIPVGLAAALAACALLLAVEVALAADPPPSANVLVIFSNNRLLQANVDVDRGLNADPAQSVTPIRFFAEFLDAPSFAGEAYETNTATYLRRKYASRPPKAIVAGGSIALDFVLRHRAEMFPDTPVVHVGVDRGYFNALDSSQRAGLAGYPVDYDIEGTLALALKLHPRAERVIVVTGSSAWDRAREADARNAVAKLRIALPVEFLAGLAQADLIARLTDLSADSIVVTPGYFADATGRITTPRDSVEAMLASSRAPIYTPFSSQIGIGIVGGRMTSFFEMGRATRAILESLLQGRPGPALDASKGLVDSPHLDWRQVRRWGIPAELIPDDAVVHFRPPSLWETYRAQVIVAMVVLLIQTGLIVALLLERRRRRRIAAALARSERQLTLAVDAARLSPFVWQVEGGPGHGSAQSPRAADLRKTARQSLPDALAAVHPADRHRVDAAVRAAAGGGDELDIEYRTLDAGGAVRWFAARGRATADAASPSLTGVCMDITMRKEAELQAEADRAALRHLSRVSTMGQLSAAIAHQLNQPLAAILGNAETARKMLGRRDTSVEEMREILDDIITEDHRAAQVIRRLGDLYRRGDVAFEPLDLNELVRETLDLLRAELMMRHVTPLAALADGLPPVAGNRVQLQQLLLNLILNAADAMASIPLDSRTVMVRTSFEGGSVKTCVTDRGKGIAPQDLPRIFDPFWTTKEHGLGVGLAICNAIATTHKGVLTASNQPAGGAVLCFTLPLAVNPQAETRHASRIPG